MSIALLPLASMLHSIMHTKDKLRWPLQEFHLTLDGVKEALAAVAAQRQPPAGSYSTGGGRLLGGYGASGALLANLAWLLGTAAGYAQRALSRADVAAVLLSRKVLLDRLPMHGEAPRSGWLAAQARGATAATLSARSVASAGAATLLRCTLQARAEGGG